MSEPAPLSLTITGTEAEVRQYLDGPRLACELTELDELVRGWVKYGHHGFKDINAALGEVRVRLGEMGREK